MLWSLVAADTAGCTRDVGIGVAGTGLSNCGPAIGLAANITDRASVETDRALELRTRDRERKLISKINEALLAQNIHVMHQVGRIRIAVHGYNTAEDIEKLLATLRAAL